MKHVCLVWCRVMTGRARHVGRCLIPGPYFSAIADQVTTPRDAVAVFDEWAGPLVIVPSALVETEMKLLKGQRLVIEEGNKRSREELGLI